MYDFITIGSAFRDTMFATDKVDLLTVQKPYKRKVMAFDYGAKFNIDHVSITIGGGACNTAVDLKKLGANVIPLAAIGKDAEAADIIDKMDALGIDTTYLKKTNHNTAFSTIVAYNDKTKKEKEHIIFACKGANMYFDLSKSEMRTIQTQNMYLASLKANKWQHILDVVLDYYMTNHRRGNNINWFWNPGQTQLCAGKRVLSKYLEHVDVLQLNRKEAMDLIISSKKKVRNTIPALMKELHSYGACIILLTDGKDGAYVSDRNTIVFEPIYDKIQTVDTTGVGDAFGSTFAYTYSKFFDIKKALQYASINAGYVSSVIGAQKGGLTLRKIKEIHKKHYLNI